MTAKEQARIEQSILGIAARQHGVVTRAQLVNAGLSDDMVDRRLKQHRLQPVFRGVYAIGPVLPPHAVVMAAVLVCGTGMVVSHCSAAVLWRLAAADDAAVVELSAVRGDHSRRPGIRMHRVSSLSSRDVTKLEGIPVTIVARTLSDLSATSPRRYLERALAEALDRRLTTRQSLLARLSRVGRGPGTARLRALLQADSPPALTRSEAEERFLRLIRKAGLPDPSLNVKVNGYEVDFIWRAERLVVEVDGHAFHSSVRAFEADRRRDTELVASGLRVVRVTWRQIVGEPEALLVRLAQLLGSGTGRTQVAGAAKGRPAPEVVRTRTTPRTTAL